MRWTGHITGMEESRGVCRVLVRKPEGKRKQKTQVLLGG